MNKYTVTLTCSCGAVMHKHVPGRQLQVETEELMEDHKKTCAKLAGIGYEKESDD